MLGGKYVSKEIDHAYKNWELFTPLVQVSFGINKLVESESPIIIVHNKDLSIGRTKLDNGFSVMNMLLIQPWHLKGKPLS
jgi:nitrogen fixation protein